MLDSDLYRRYLFFRRMTTNAIFAIDLARAERWAEEEDIVITWEFDPEPWEPSDIEDYTPAEVLCCLACLDGESSSLGGIADPDKDYQRLIAAELCLDLQTRVYDVMAETCLTL